MELIGRMGRRSRSGEGEKEGMKYGREKDEERHEGGCRRGTGSKRRK